MCKKKGAKRKITQPDDAAKNAKAKGDSEVDESVVACALAPPPPPEGKITLLKLKFNTANDVCADDVENFNDYKHFYILTADSKTEYHWLLEKKDIDDKSKPDDLPITYHSNETLACTAYFEVEAGKTVRANPVVRIGDDPAMKFTFDKQTGGATAGPFELTFTAKNFPYKDTVDYIAKFELKFEYSTDGETTWLSAGASSNELYITWKAPDTAVSFLPHADEKLTMQIKSNKTGTKFYIPETLLYIGCKGARTKGKDESEILDAIFSELEGLRVNRRRLVTKDSLGNTMDGMGYWRGLSVPYGLIDTRNKTIRGLRYLLKNGEARCGEWMTFFNYLAFTQGKIKMGQLAFRLYGAVAEHYINRHVSAVALFDTKLFTDGYKPGILLVKNCKMLPQSSPPSGTPTIENMQTSKAQGNDDAVNIFTDHVFSVHEGTKRFYDASYGKGKSYFPDKASSTFSKYCTKMLDGILFVTNPGTGPDDVYIRHYKKNFFSKVKHQTVTTNEFVYFYLDRGDIA